LAGEFINGMFNKKTDKIAKIMKTIETVLNVLLEFAFNFGLRKIRCNPESKPMAPKISTGRQSVRETSQFSGVILIRGKTDRIYKLFCIF